MIFITLGSQKFQFNRLLKKVDELVEKGIIKDEVFAQTGYSDYKPNFYNYKDFLSRDEFIDFMDRSEIVITHGGTGAIINAVKKEKKVIAVPRLAKYGEHVDNHQLDIVNEFNELNYIIGLEDIEKVEEGLQLVMTKQFNKYKSNTQNIINLIENFINSASK